jgi:phage terminase large subunit GpA-like protein
MTKTTATISEELESEISAVAISKLQSSGANLWAPKAEVSFSDFCNENIWLSPLHEATPGKFNLEENPFWREPLDCFTNPDVYEITVMKSTQVGGTLVALSAIIALSEVDPAPMMLVLPEESSATEARDRLYDNALESPMFSDRVPARRHWNLRSIDLRTMRCYLAMSGKRQSLRGRPCKRVFRSETDVYTKHKNQISGDPIAASGERVKRFYWSQIYNESSPSGEDSFIAESYDLSDQRRWMCKCPHCGKHQELRFYPYRDGPNKGFGGVTGFLDGKGDLLPEDEARRRARYICENGCEINNNQKNQMVKTGRWVPAGQWIDDETGEVQGTPTASGRHRGYRLWSIHSPVISLGKLVGAYVEMKTKGKLREFHETWLGRRWRKILKTPDWQKLGKRLRLSYQRLEVPQDCWFLVGAGDVQENGVYWNVRGWGHMGTSWLIDWGFIRRFHDTELIDGAEVSSDLARFETEVMNRRFFLQNHRMNPLGKTELRVKLAGIDGGYRIRDVHNFLVTRFGDEDPETSRLRIVRGDDKVDPGERFRRSMVERNVRTGEVYEGGLHQWRIYTPTYKEDLLTKYSVKADTPGALHFPANILSESGGESYLRQITNEYPDDELNEKTNRKRRVWKVRQPSIGNHYFDLEVYNAALAEMLLFRNNLTWDSSTWPAPQVVDAGGGTRERYLTLPTDNEPVVMARDYF